LGVGLPITLMATVEILSSTEPAQDRQDAMAALILFGLPPSATGGWLIWNAYRQQQQQDRDRLRSAFFHLLRQGNGHLTVLQFAMETGLDGEAARTYLDQRAREFSATFEVTEDGKLFYDFAISGIDALSLPATGTETYDK